MLSTICELMCTIVLGSTEIYEKYVVWGFAFFFNTLSIAACALQSLLFITLQIRGKESLSCLFLCFQSSSSLALEYHGIPSLLSVALLE